MKKKEESDKKPYCINLDKLEVNKAKTKIESVGGKVSTLLNNLLKKFNRE